LKITCGSFICGTPGNQQRVIPNDSGAFIFDFTIPTSSDAKGKYEIISDTNFGKTTISFIVTDKSEETGTGAKSLISSKRVTEKFNRISDTIIPMMVTQKQVDDEQLAPRVIQGSLITPARGEESKVNLKISTPQGLCVIGPDPDCLVKESTRSPGSIYQIEEINGINYKIRYSGPDVRLEKFSIIPESSNDIIPDSTWITEVVKDEQTSRFYYKITRVVIG